MHTRQLDIYDPLEDFEPRKLAFNEVTKMVHVSGKGPAVIVIPEVPGISPHVARFARWVREAGFTVYMPSLYGRDGEPVDLDIGRPSSSACASVRNSAPSAPADRRRSPNGSVHSHGLRMRKAAALASAQSACASRATLP